MSEESPTKVIPTTTWRPRSKPPSRGPLVAFVVVAVLLVASAGYLLYLVFGRGDVPSPLPTATPTVQGTPSASASSAAPTAPTPTADAQPAGVFTEFAPVSVQQCQGRGRKNQTVDLQVTWSTENATSVWLAPGNGNAAGVGEPIPLSGNQDSFPYPVPLNCNAVTETFTMTLIGDDGADVSQMWTVTIQHRHY